MKSPLAIALAFILVLCSLRMVEKTRQEHHSEYLNDEYSQPLTFQPLVADGHQHDQKEGLNLHDDGRHSNDTPLKPSH